jgi:L-galactose dehydrogenase
MGGNDLVPRRVLSVHNNPHLPKEVPLVGLGCSSFSHFFWSSEELKAAGGLAQWTPDSIDRSHPQVEEWIRTILYAVRNCGINLLDTAPWYGHGTSEVVVGWAVEELLRVGTELSTHDEGKQSTTDLNNELPLSNYSFQRSSIIINTKVGRYNADPETQFDFSFQTTLQSVQRSLERMKCDYIDVLQLHDPEFSPSLSILLKETIPAMMECRNRGWCRALGITGYPLEVQHQILMATKEQFDHVVFDISLTYCHYNLHDDSLFTRPIANMAPCTTNTNLETKFDSLSLSPCSFADFVHSQSLALMAAAPLSMGLLIDDGPPPDWHPASPDLKLACHEASMLLKSAKVDHTIHLSELAMIMALANPRIPCTLVGMKNIQQVQWAAQAACRFSIMAQTDEMDPNRILSQVLNEQELFMYRQLRDLVNGPFASVWRDGSFRWDGSKAGYEFWNQVKSVQAEHWQAKPY